MAYFVAGIIFQAGQYSGRSHIWCVFVEPGDSRLSKQGMMATDIVVQPGIVLLIEIPHIVSEGSLQLAIGLRMIHRCMNEAHAHALAKGREQSAFERRAI